jgi:dihydropteroate synthase
VTASAAIPYAAVQLAGNRSLDLSAPRVMGVINVTPDSFSDGGVHLDSAAAVAAALRMAQEGAAILDVGGESTRPGAPAVSEADELARVLPVIEALHRSGLTTPISIDTRKAAVAEAALAAGAVVVNDVTGLADPDMARVTAAAGAALVIGHIQGKPRTMQRAPTYEDVVADVHAALAAARQCAVDAGVAGGAILVDPGIGFGKTLEHNLTLLAHLDAFSDLGPVVVGVSRKSMLGALLSNRPVTGRLAGGLGAAVSAILGGARIIRTHDVLATADAVHVAWRIAQSNGGARVAVD